MNTSITQDLLELMVPTAIKWDQLSPETQKQPCEVETHSSVILVKKTEGCLYITLILSYVACHSTGSFIASSVFQALCL